MCAYLGRHNLSGPTFSQPCHIITPEKATIRIPIGEGNNHEESLIMSFTP